jgi:hypothetical protein
VYNPTVEGTPGGVTFSVQNRDVESGHKTTQFDVKPADIVLTTDFTGTKNEWTFGADGTTHFPGSLILAPASQSITLQSDQYTQLMWSHVTDQSTPDMYGNTNSDFYVESGNATLDIGYIDGTQKYVSWYWSKDGSLTFPQGGALRVGTVPSHSTGAAGDKAGTVAFASGYIYYCTNDYSQTGHQVTIATLYNGGTSINSNSLQLTLTSDTLQIAAGDTIRDANNNTSTVYSTGTDNANGFVYVSTGSFAFNCTFPLTFTSSNYVSGGNIWKRVAWSGDTW